MGVKCMWMARPGTASCLKRMAGIKKLWMTSSARRITSISRFTGTYMVPATRSCFEAEGRFASAGRILQLRLGGAEFSIRSGVAKIPLELHARDFHFDGVGDR